jgi:hypothetical protein
LKGRSFLIIAPLGLAVSLLVVAICAISSAGFAIAKVDSRDIWCLESPHMNGVVLAAELNGLGEAAGRNRKMLRPRGSTTAISLRKWRLQEPADFRLACDGAYEASMGPAAQRASDDDSGADPSLSEIALAPASALLGSVLGFLFSKLSRAEERRRSEAAAMQTSLNELLGELDQLIPEVESEGNSSEIGLAVLRRASILCNSLPPGREHSVAATVALSQLIAALEPEAGGNSESDAKRLKRLGTEVRDQVGRLIAEIED